MKKQDENVLTKEEINNVLDKLYKLYPNAQCELQYNTPFELLISTILSAQCTDLTVNKVTRELYEKYNTPEAMLTLTQEELGEKIKSCGFYKMKSTNILNTCNILVTKYNSNVPEYREELMNLPGVGRKTANVVISNAFGQAAIAVDTHVFRVSNRIGLANSENVNDTEKQLMRNIPKKKWSDAHHWIIYHGRRVCKARKPLCEECTLIEKCVYYRKMTK
ncbi:endonuclease III [Lutibacter sp. B2]|nr:endonuclease III [Lutibacter sp. B2]